MLIVLNLDLVITGNAQSGSGNSLSSAIIVIFNGSVIKNCKNSYKNVIKNLFKFIIL